MGKPVERQNHALSFFILSMLISVCTAWSFYDEFISRRPWKGFQERNFAYEREKTEQDLSYVERKLESGDIKVTLSGTGGGVAMTVAEAEHKLEEAKAGQQQHREEIEKLTADKKRAEIEVYDQYL